MKKFDVYGIGNALVDMEYRVTNEFLSAHNIEKSLMTLVDSERQTQIINSLHSKDVKEIKRQCGGSAANTMIAISQFGGKSFYSCKVASDDTGKFFLGDLEENGVVTQARFNDLEEGISGKCMVMITPDAQRTMNTFLGVSSEFSKDELREDELKDSKWLYIEGYLVASESGQIASMAAKEIAKKNDVKIAFTFSDRNMIKFFRDNVNAIIGEGLDLIFCNEEEVREFCETDDLEVAKEKMKTLSKNYVITRGKDGAVIWDGKEFIDIEPNKVEAIDSNGAGDMFAGAFLFALTHDYSLQDAGKLASLASSKVVAQFGPRLPWNDMREIRKQIKRGI